MNTKVNKHFNAKNINGQKFNQLTCISYSHSLKGKPYCNFLCDCGKEVIKAKGNVVSGHTKSCGHLKPENTRKANKTRNGASSRPLWSTYKSMINRCNNKKDPSYHRYGGRGIKVCDEWVHDYFAFEKYMGDRQKGMTVDRIDNNGNYEPGNVRWATRKQQSNNTSVNIKNRQFIVNGKILNIQEYADYLGIKTGTLYWRKKNWGRYEKKK